MDGHSGFEEILVDGKIKSYQWIPTRLMWAGTFTKEMEMHKDIEELLAQGNFSLT